MRIAYLDCFAGISGDMFLGALLDAGVPAEVLAEAAAALDLGASLQLETVDRSGISSVKVHVFEGGRLAEAAELTSAARAGDGSAQEGDARGPLRAEQEHSHRGYTHSHGTVTREQPPRGQNEPHGPAQGSQGHMHGRSLTEIRERITAAPLAEPVRAFAIAAFELLGHAEAKIHNVPVDQIHFHEVGAVDAIVDIVCASAGVHYLQVEAWYASAVNVGGGMVECAHGIFPVPAPATADLLRAVPTYSAHLQKELVTPTGAVLLRALHPTFGAQPPMRVQRIGYGAGTRNPPGFPNVLRLQLGETDQANSSPASGKAEVPDVVVLEAALDDLSPQLLAYVAEKALGAGALDVMMTPVLMKKGRPGTLLTVLCRPEQASAFESLLLTETSTLGVRSRREQRRCLDRRHVAVQTGFGAIRVKIGSEGGTDRNVAPEFEDCRRAAEQHGVPLKLVQQAAMAAWTNGAGQ